MEKAAMAVNAKREEVEVRMVPLTFVKQVHEIRPLNADYVQKLREKLRQIGLKPYPLSVAPDGTLFGGRHRLEAFKQEGITECLMHIWLPDSLDREAIELNRASEDALPMTFVDYAELIWRKLETQTQDAIGKELGWTRQAVSNYAALQKIDGKAWDQIATTVRAQPMPQQNGDVADIATSVAFTEGLLRSILSLTPDQQMELVTRLLRGKDSKGHSFGKKEFKERAEYYAAYNRLLAAAELALAERIAGEEWKAFWNAAVQELQQPIYVEELTDNGPGPRFAALIQTFVDEYEKTINSKVLVKDMRTLTAQDVPDGSIDAIVTDPPYPREYVGLFDNLGFLAARVLKPGGSLLVLCGQSYLPQYFDLLSRHLDYLWTIGIHMPGGQAVQLYQKEVTAFWKPALWFTKGLREAPKWASDFIRTEVNNNDKRHHKWGQSEEIMAGLVERATLAGDTVLDPFLGGGTTGVVCRKMNRKFLGVEIDTALASQASHRIGEIK
jgi:hypothetical protein